MCPSAWVVLCVVVHMCVVCVCLCAWEKSWKKQGSSKAQKYYFPTIVYDTSWSFNGSLHSRTFLEQLKRVDIKLVYKKNSWIDNKNQRQSLFYQTSEIYEIFEFSQLSNCSMLFCHYKVRINWLLKLTLCLCLKEKSLITGYMNLTQKSSSEHIYTFQFLISCLTFNQR